MLQKSLAWSSFATAMLFAIAGSVAVFASEWLGDSAQSLLLYVAIPLLVISILLAIALLVVSLFD